MANVYVVAQSEIGTVYFGRESSSFLSDHGGMGPDMDIDFVNAFVDWVDTNYPPSQPTRIWTLDDWEEVIPT